MFYLNAPSQEQLPMEEVAQPRDLSLSERIALKKAKRDRLKAVMKQQKKKQEALEKTKKEEKEKTETNKQTKQTDYGNVLCVTHPVRRGTRTTMLELRIG